MEFIWLSSRSWVKNKLTAWPLNLYDEVIKDACSLRTRSSNFRLLAKYVIAKYYAEMPNLQLKNKKKKVQFLIYD